jgi:amino acid permease
MNIRGFWKLKTKIFTTMKQQFAFTKINFILLAVGIAIIMAGLLLMSGGGTTVEKFDPEIFNAQRIRVAPMVTFFGYLFIVVAILYRGKSKSTEIEYRKEEK